MSNLKVIAFYLPQFHPIKENDEWWGMGFTEWTNVGKAKPLFKGHYQPRVPADLGYYDLRIKDVREKQVELAREAGISAFCYWHYWFAGKQLMNDIFDDVLASGTPDFPFCLGWANHSWYAKTWDKNSPDKLLIEQTYPGMEDAHAHFEYLIKAFKDNRYLKIDGKPLLFIYDTENIPEEYLSLFRKWTIEAGFKDIYLIGYSLRTIADRTAIYNKGINSIVYNRYWDIDDRVIKKIGIWGYRLSYMRALFDVKVLHRPSHVMNFKKTYKYLVTRTDEEENVVPQILAGFDHSPRSGKGGFIFKNFTPDLFYKHAKEALCAVRKKNEKVVVVKSWNEWAEGNYLEPDLKYGHQYIQALRRAIDEFENMKQ